ncbi:hypothetical protein HPB49_006698 [Dermacentor silvarum]|uniref:Uncharacterized protein n=1 Tax=Dermacentor silvarum TaxID=543639 RepID=A0ACB8DW69_DERSI|nr:hypothetical protein HPB49_006698 [Dermacentor silvarum]
MVTLPQETPTNYRALLIMFNPMFESWVQPIARYATKGAAPGWVLAKIVMNTVLELSEHGAKVVAVNSDGAGNNKSMWTHLAISGKLAGAQYKIAHPCIDGAFLHFMCDVPHIIKSVRNRMMKHKYGLIGEHQANYQHYERLFETEKKAHIKVVPKLTEYHVKPQRLQTMNVRLATQLFSQSVGIGLEVYRQLTVPGFADSTGTEEFTLLMNDLFDILNAKVPPDGIKKGSPKIQFLKDFLEMMNRTESNKNVKLFASAQTVESIRVTLMSILSLIEFLDSKGVNYILTGSLNQDPLERFFGLLRSFGGDEDHPMVTKFSQIFRILSLYTPVKMAVKENCETGSDRILLSAFESLGAKRKDALRQKSVHKELVWKKLMAIPFTELCSAADDHGYNAPAPETTALYYLAGYVAFKLRKTTRCENCMKEALGSHNSLPPEAVLVIERAFVTGSLVFPSNNLFTYISSVEHTFRQVCKGETFGDLFWDVLDALIKKGTNTVGCPEHAEKLTAELIHFYLLTCMHFFAQLKWQENDSAVRAQREHKKAQLV